MTKAACIDSNTKGQDLRREGKLSAAREQFLTCASASCPSILRDDCTRRLDEVERALPTLVIDAKDAAGQDVSAVTVTVDGAHLADKLAGAPLAVDPGEHVFVFQVAGQAPVTRTFVLKEGERDRRERVVVGAVPPPAIPASPAGASPGAGASPVVSNEAAGGQGARKWVGLTVAGIGVAGIAAGAVFGILTLSQTSQQKTDCAAATDCNSHAQALADHSSATTDGTIATVGFIAGGALLATGAVLFFTGNTASEPARAGLRVTPGIGSVAVTGRF
jgi:hypothetical protein